MIDDLTKSTIAEAFGLKHLRERGYLANEPTYATYVWIAMLPKFSLWIENARKKELLYVAMVETDVSRRAMLFVPTMNADKTQFTGYLPLSPLDLPEEKDPFIQALSCFDLSFQQNEVYMDGYDIGFNLYVATRRTEMDYQIEYATSLGNDKPTRIYHALLGVVRWLAQTHGSNEVVKFLNEHDRDRLTVFYRDNETGKVSAGFGKSFMETGR
jgi:hypothetical protein